MLRIILLSLFFICFVNANTYKVDFYFDKDSNILLDKIESETKKLFSSDDRINFNMKLCQDCFFKNKGVYLVKKVKKSASKKGYYTVSYNTLSSKYDEDRIIRATALGIFEYLKENKYKSIYIKNNNLNLDIKQEDKLQVLNLQNALKLAKKNNIKLKKNENSLELQKIGVSDAKSDYRPKIDLFSNYIQIDKDRAKVSRGLNPEKTLEAGVKLRQLIYSNKALKNIEIKRLLYKSTSQEIRALNDEVLYKTVLLYLNIIKSKKYEQIVKMKFDFIKKNLFFAKQRVEVGITDKSDIYRWQNELANTNIQLTTAKKNIKKLEIELFNLLRVNEKYSFFEYDLNSKLFKILNKDAIKYLENKKVQKMFTDELIFTHPRLKQIKELIKLKNKQRKMNKQSYYLPTLAFEGSAKKILKREGEASNTPRTWDDKEYQAVLNLNLPLYEGGAKSVDIQKNEIELIDLKLQYNNAKDMIIENVKKNYNSLIYSYKNIVFAKSSLEASKKNFELMQDKYKNGEVNIISLLDSQNSFIISNLNLNISNIDYLVDLTSTYFFSGKIDILADEMKKLEIENKIENIIKD